MGCTSSISASRPTPSQRREFHCPVCGTPGFSRTCARCGGRCNLAATRRCARCREQVLSHETRCRKCRARLACTRCREQVLSHETRCRNCGARLARLPPSAPVESRELEDIAKSIQELVDCLDPEQKVVHNILKGCSNRSLFSGAAWSCPLCTFRNRPGAKSCETCERRYDGTKKQIEQKRGRKRVTPMTPEQVKAATLESAVESIMCPVCLDIYNSPVTLPCGHSLCVHDAEQLVRGKCPICRSAFSKTQVARAKNVSLAQNVNSVVVLASLADPGRETIRDAARRMGLLPRVASARQKLEVLETGGG